ncbi:MAG: hypothetical protein HYT77_06085 [Deltaproteobacteria bacterium]|nr:hypothetical protein [Deltaproteobacteria bacterium]
MKRFSLLLVVSVLSMTLITGCTDTDSSESSGNSGGSSSSGSGSSSSGGASSDGAEGENSPGGSTSAGNPGGGDVEGSTSAGNPLSFNLAGAIGLVVVDSSNSSSLRLTDNQGTSSNLKRVNQDNSLSDAVSSGSVNVKNFMVAANNQVYLLLSTPVDSCILIRVDGETNEATCVDSSISNFIWNTGLFYKHDPIQFDGEGAVYYMFGSADGRLVLRKNLAGTITDLINDNISVEDFLVLSDGTVFITGKTTSTAALWIRKISPANSLENIFTSATANFMSLFPDGNVYMGIWAAPIYGVARYLTADSLLDNTNWMTLDINGLQEPRYYDCNEVSSRYGFGGWCGSYVKAIHRTINDRVYAIAGGTAAQGVLVQYYPEVVEPVTSVTQVTASQSVLTSLLLAGVDSESTNRLVLFETTTEMETDLLGDEDIEVYNLNYLNSNNHQIVMFDGLRFSDNRYVLCQVDLTNNNALTCSVTGTSRLTGFQLFNEE